MHSKIHGKAAVLAVLIAVAILEVVSAQSFSTYFTSGFSGSSYSKVNAQIYQPTIKSMYSREQISTYWPVMNNLNSAQCIGRKDFVVNMAPAGCEPAVVRSDLLEEQNVPVFCKLEAFKINPLIDVKSIDRIVFSGTNYPPEIAGVGYYPARAALRSYNNLLGSPLLNDIGYAVVILKRNPVEKNMPDYVTANLKAVLKYDMGNAWSVGRGEYYLSVMSDEEWKNDYKKYGFWNGKGYLRLDSIDESGNVELSVYSDADKIIDRVKLKIGQTSSDIYLPGYYCMASMNIRLEGTALPELSAVIQVGDDQLEVRKGSRFWNNLCYVTGIESYGQGNGRVDVSCSGERKPLTLNFASVRLMINNENEKRYSVGDRVSGFLENNQFVYLAYYGKVPLNLKDSFKLDEEGQFIVLLNTSDNKNLKIDSIRKRINDYVINTGKDKSANLDKFKEGISNLAGHIGGKYNLVVLFNADGQKEAVFGGTKVEFLGNDLDERHFESSKNDNRQAAGKKIEEYFDNAKTSYESVADKYPNEKTDESGQRDAYGEISLMSAAELAGRIEKKLSERELLTKLIEKYPNGNFRNAAESKMERLSISANSDASYTFKNPRINVELLEIKELEKKDLSADLAIRDSSGKIEIKNGVMQGEIILQLKDDEYFKIAKIEKNRITLDYSCNEPSANGQSITQKGQKLIEERDSLVMCGNSIYVDKINFREMAKLVVIPNIKGSESEVNFTVKIGIEKRAIKISTEKAEEMISNLNKTIETWENINEKLGNAVSAMKGICFATSMFLQAKTLLGNFEGGSMARNWVMRGRDGSSGWMDKCERAVSSGNIDGKKVNYASIDDCLRQNNPEIEKEVNYYTNLIKQENARIQAIEASGGITTDIWGQKNVNTDAYRKKQIDSVISAYKDSDVEGVSSDGKKMKVGDVLDNTMNTDVLTIEDMNSIEMNMRILQDAGAPANAVSQAKQSLYATLSRIDSARQIANPGGLNDKLGMTVDIYENEKSFKPIYRGTYLNENLRALGVEGEVGKTPIQTVSFNGEVYAVTLEKINSRKYNPLVFYKRNSQGNFEKTSENKDKNNLYRLFQVFNKVDAGSYKNQYKNPQVRYWETEPCKGYPALVPVDVNDGWYAATKQTLPTLGNVKPCENSGRITSFWLCNVGANGIEQFTQGIGDDICQMINLGIGQSADLFPGLSSSQASALIQKAQRILMEAAEKHSSGLKRVSLSSGTFDIGNPASMQLGTSCQDFMSAEDCNILFNVCDPVICPTSRCNLGGTYYVDDVVQSGVIGSIALCLPNLREGIVVPICLTGVHAGLEGYLSILKAHRDCLQKSIDSGEHVGICDEIYSIYLCEFFWRQLAPLLNIFIPKMIESAYGQGVRGGGEYLTVQHAWDTMQQSVNYFTSYYAANAIKAFQIRNTQEVGTTVCKAFVSAKYANLKLLLEPESPSQFYAEFRETAYTSATVPATSQYKVYYHIYAGKDDGVYYSVYLKNPSPTSFYQSYGTVNVETGYIPKGEYADKTKDFTAPSGYKELCIMINSKENCGFKKFTSDFALNYISDKFVEEQATAQVTSESECISGTRSLYALVNLNIQSGIEEAAIPALYNRGITRICSTADPGSNSEPGRWKQVGWCDGSQKKVGCWIDVSQVKEVIKEKGIENSTLAEIDNMNSQKLLGESYSEIFSQAEENIDLIKNKIIPDSGKAGEIFFGMTLSDDNFKEALNNYDKILNEASEKIDYAVSRAVQNNQKAQLLYLKGRMWDNATRMLYTFFETCRQDADCEDGYKCIERRCSVNKNARRPESSGKEECLGKQCDSNSDCSENCVESNLYCRKDDSEEFGTCEDIESRDIERDLADWKDKDLQNNVSIVVKKKIIIIFFSKTYKYDSRWIPNEEPVKDKGYVEGISALVSDLKEGDKIEVSGKEFIAESENNSDIVRNVLQILAGG